MRILLVDDEVKFSSVLRSGLEEHGYAVDLAHDGEQGTTWRPSSRTTW
jgi:DNA-binding response OmpR family regulator